MRSAGKWCWRRAAGLCGMALMLRHRLVDADPVEAVMGAEILVLGPDHGPLQPGGDVVGPGIMRALALARLTSISGVPGMGRKRKISSSRMGAGTSRTNSDSASFHSQPRPRHSPIDSPPRHGATITNLKDARCGARCYLLPQALAGFAHARYSVVHRSWASSKASPNSCPYPRPPICW